MKKLTRRPLRRPDRSGQPLRALFIGNSFTARNDLPGLIAALAEAAGTAFEHDLVTAGGASLRRHWNTGAAREAIGRGGYDFVILQEQSTLPIKNARRMRENVLLFDEAIRAAAARTVLYMTWARHHAPQTQQAITDAYTSIAGEIGALVIPAGEAWQRLLSEGSAPALHDRDQSHPTMAGSFLAACVAFAVLFERDPATVSVSIEGLSTDQAKLLQASASQTMADSERPASPRRGRR